MATKKKSKKIQNTQLNLGIGSDLFLQFKNREEYFPSYIIGLKPDAFIIIKTPTVLGKEYRLSKGRQIILKYKHLGELFRFNTSVIESFDKPFKITFISYPEQVEKIEFRNSPRVFCSLPASLFSKDNEIKGMVTDISTGGCRFKTKDIDIFDDIILIKKDEEVTLHFPLLGLDGIKEFKCRIKKIGFDDDITLNIGFKEIDAKIRDMIASYVETTSE